MTPEERAAKIWHQGMGLHHQSYTPRAMVELIAAEIRAAVEEATEDLIWNLAGCSTFAMGYGLDEPFDKSKARAAMFDVHKLALKYRTAKAEAYEDAAKIVDGKAIDWRLLYGESVVGYDGAKRLERLAATIRARAKEVK